MNRTGLAALMAALAMTGTACGDGAQQAGPGGGVETETEVASARFCSAKAALDAISPDTPDNAALRAVQEQMRPALERLEGSAPGDLAEHVRTVAEAHLGHDTLEETVTAVSGERFAEASSVIAEHTLQECGFAQAVFTAADDRYTSAPETVEAGQTLLFLRNQGRHVHAVVLFRLNEGVTDTAAELAADGAFERKGQFATSLFGPVASSAGVVTQLRPGRYFYFDDEHLEDMHGVFTVR